MQGLIIPIIALIFLLILLAVELVSLYRIRKLCSKILEDIEKIRKGLPSPEDQGR